MPKKEILYYMYVICTYLYIHSPPQGFIYKTNSFVIEYLALLYVKSKVTLHN